MSNTVVKKSFMDKFTGFFYKFGHYMLMIIAYLGVIALAIITGVQAGMAGFFKPDSMGPSIAFVIAVVLLGLSLIFSFIKRLKKIANYFFASIGFISVLILGIVTGVMFFGKTVNGDLNYQGVAFNYSNSLPWGAITGGSFIVACILIGLVVIGGIAYAISMADNRKKAKELKNSQQAN